ncbi:MAG: outer-membrane lipoprotein carrier protein LolA [Isosphaeraceae bacterium]
MLRPLAASRGSSLSLLFVLGLGGFTPESKGQSQPPVQPPRAAAVPAQARPAAQPAQAPAQQTQAQAAPAKSPEELARLAQRMELLLKTWEERSTLVKELDAEFVRRDHSPAWQEMSDYKGRALLKSPDLAYLDFEKLNTAEKKYLHHERIIATGKDVYHYQTASRQVFIYPLSAEERAKALEEGPLPFLFNMKADKAKKRYNMSILSENEQGAWIQIIPLEKFDQESFSKVYVLLNKQQFLPDRLILWAPNGKDTQSYTFKTIKVNGGIDTANFIGTVPAKGWDVVRNPAGASQPPANRPGQPAAPAAGAAVAPARTAAGTPGQNPIRR